MLAASRKDSVINRTEILTVSIRTRNGFNQSGAPDGRKWAVKDLGLCVAPLIIRESHRGRPNERVNKRCPEVLKIYGISPRRFKEIRTMKRDVRIKVKPFK